jgi:hypothetical protein
MWTTDDPATLASLHQARAGEQGNLRGTIQEQKLILPELFIEGSPIVVETEMRSLFDMLWNAAGWPRSFNYGADGSYVESNWRNSFA